jgi:hypothetical protein
MKYNKLLELCGFWLGFCFNSQTVRIRTIPAGQLFVIGTDRIWQQNI